MREAFNLLQIREPFAVPDDQPHLPPARAPLLDAAESLDRAAVTPLLMIIDDLQWADFATLEFLAFLMPRGSIAH